MAARKAAAAEEDVRESGRRLVEEARKKREAATAAAAAASAPPPSRPSKPPPISSQDLTITLSLPPGEEFTQESLESTLHAKYGKISTVILAPSKQKEGKKARGPRAVVEFAPGNWGGCWACHHDGGVPGGKAKWAAGEEPLWVAWARREAPSAPSSASAPGDFSSAPDFMSAERDHASRRAELDAQADAQAAAQADASALESATLFAMRQRERERLAEQIRRQEAEDD